MVAAKLALLSLALVAGKAAATAVAARHDAFRTLLRARQGSIISPGDIAPECQSACATFVQINNDCQTDDSKCLEICTDSNMGGVADCLSCAINVGGPPDASLAAQAQEALDELEDDCASAGEPVQSFTVSGAAGVPTSAAGGAGASSLSLPRASETSQSVFFSSGGAAPTSTKPVVTPGPGASTNGGGGAPGPTNTPAGQNTDTDTGAGVPTQTPGLGNGNGAASLFGGVSAAAAAAAVGAALMLALNL